MAFETGKTLFQTKLNLDKGTLYKMNGTSSNQEYTNDNSYEDIDHSTNSKNKYYLTKRPIYKERLKGLNMSNKKFYKQLFFSVDSNGYISQELGYYLESLFDNSSAICTHFSGYTYIDNNNLSNSMVASYFTDGIVNCGDKMQGIVYNNNNLHLQKTLSTCNDILMLVRNLKLAYTYKSSRGAFVLKIPRQYFENELQYINELYNIENGQFYIKPEYIVGYIPNDHGNLLPIYLREQFLKENVNNNKTV